ncbi:hypothetical protein DID88_007784 [Monilinia fructigena]|uniref:Uncharacterized protein n=1 Tax=Monilinia fructigena TaxID=38457 RepID=A0A395J4F9_9HELO|nr:hypothetical protein DID88_007784 [Monilinia fructigena]
MQDAPSNGGRRLPNRARIRFAEPTFNRIRFHQPPRKNKYKKQILEQEQRTRTPKAPAPALPIFVSYLTIGPLFVICYRSSKQETNVFIYRTGMNLNLIPFPDLSFILLSCLVSVAVQPTFMTKQK